MAWVWRQRGNEREFIAAGRLLLSFGLSKGDRDMVDRLASPDALTTFGYERFECR